MSISAPGFGARLDLALKLLNISRGTVASEARVDKSLVSRWLRDLAAPRDHNLMALTQLVRSRVPSFTQLGWTLPLDEFTRALGAAPRPAQPPPDRAAGPHEQAAALSASRRQSAVEVAREGHAYPGLYVTFRLALRNSGQLISELVVIWRQGGRLLFRQYDPSFSHGGEVLVLRHQLFFVGEDDGRVDGLMYFILNGITGQKAMRMDGMMMTVLNDRDRTPGATLIVFQRLADLVQPDTPPAEPTLAEMRARLAEAFHQDRVAQLAGPEIDRRVRPWIEPAAADGLRDHILRAPAERSCNASEVNWTDRLAAHIGTVRDHLVIDAAAFPFAQPGRN